MQMFRIIVIVLCLAAGTVGHSAERPISGSSRALIVSVDGLRPDLLLRAEAPVLQDLVKRGSFTFWARTTAGAVTIPSHVSMLTGVPPSKHGVEWNRDLPFATPVWPARPTIFELAKGAGLSTAMAAGKSKFSVLARPGTLDWSFVSKEPVSTDDVVADSACAAIQRQAPAVFFVHLPSVDSAGHTFGWGSPEQLATIAEADRAVGRLLEAYRGRGLLDSTFILVTSDHGGAGTTHGADDARSRHIPWIAVGPGVRLNHDLTMHADLEVRTEDTFATVAWLLGLEPPKAVEGKPVTEILDDAELRKRRTPGR